MFRDEDIDDYLRKRRRWPFFSSGFFTDIDKMFEEILKDMDKQVPEGFMKERKTLDGRTIREVGPFVYGYSVKIGADGKPVIREFGNVKPSTPSFPFGKPKMELRKEREPLVDVLDVDESVKIVAELPGVQKSDIKLDATEDSLTISVDTPDRNYYKKIELPAKIDSESAKASYTNGVLEVILKKIEATSKKKKIKID